MPCKGSGFGTWGLGFEEPSQGYREGQLPAKSATGAACLISRCTLAGLSPGFPYILPC